MPQRRALLSFLLLPLLFAAVLSADTHRYHITQSFDINRTDLRLWVPLPLQSGYQNIDDISVEGNFLEKQILSDPIYGASTLYLKFDPAQTANHARVSFSVEVTDRHVDLKTPAVHSREQNLPLYLQASENVRIDGVVKTYADKITKGAKSDLEKAQRIYDWVVQNMFRDNSVKGCGIGNAYASLESGNLGGKCADVSAVFVALLRAAGIPAREVFGIRVAPSRFSKAYGVKNSNITTAQHCRAEFYLPSHGWVPADPADITKLILVEKLERKSAKVRKESARQFGSWEMNWIAYNSARDFVLSPQPIQFPLSIFSYPYAESGDEPLDYYDPASFAYTITVKSEP